MIPGKLCAPRVPRQCINSQSIINGTTELEYWILRINVQLSFCVAELSAGRFLISGIGNPLR